MDNIWVIRKESWYEMTGAFCGSLIIHALLFVILAATSIYYPPTGEVAQFDILWISPSTLPTEKLALAATPEVVTAADVIPEQTDIRPDNREPQQLPVVDKNTEFSTQPPLEQNNEDPPVEMIAARATYSKQPSPPVKPPPKPKKTAIIIPTAQPERKKTAEAAAPPAYVQAAKPEPVTKPEPPSPPPPQTPLPPEKAVAAIAEEQRLANLSAIQEQQARENAEQQRLAAERKEHELRAAEAVREKAEQQRKAAEAAKEKADRERQAAEAVQLKAEQERLAAERVRQEKRAHEREQAAAETARKKAEQQRLTQLKAEREQLAAAQLQQEKLARQRAEHARIAAEKAERERLAAAENRQRSEQERLTKLAREREQAAAENAARERQAAEIRRRNAEQERQAAEALRRSAEQQRASKEKAERQVRLAALARPQAGLRTAEAVRKEPPRPRPAEKPPEARGIVLPSIHGDLKVIITGSNDIKLTVLFREYPKSRQKRGLSRSETRREHKITPIVVKTSEKTREAVIETAREGIYIFTAEPDGAPSATATFTLKSFEQKQGAKTRSLGAKTISGKAIVARVLMPDAILWEDESAFTGSMQDSGGVTKFNSDSGLIWKEYSD